MNKFACSILVKKLIDVLNERRRCDALVGRQTELECERELLKKAILLLQKDEDLRSRIIELEAENYNLKKCIKGDEKL